MKTEQYKYNMDNKRTWMYMCIFFLKMVLSVESGSSSDESSGSSSDVECPSGFSPYGNNCYIASSDDTYTWEHAKTYCHSIAVLATLPCPVDNKEKNFIKRLLPSSEYGWLGLNDIDAEGEWWCLKKYSETYLKWNSSPEEDVTTNCVAIKSDGKYTDFECSDTHHALCVLDPLATTTKRTTTAVDITTETYTRLEPLAATITTEGDEATPGIGTTHQMASDDPSDDVTVERVTSAQLSTTVVDTITDTSTRLETQKATTITERDEAITSIGSTDQMIHETSADQTDDATETSTPRETSSLDRITLGVMTAETVNDYGSTQGTSGTTVGDPVVENAAPWVQRQYLLEANRITETTREVLVTRPNVSKTRCAATCLRDHNCHAFLFDIGENKQTICTTLGENSDFITLHSLNSSVLFEIA